jgi:hypothetical protein
MTHLLILSAAIFIVLGVLHLSYAIHDFFVAPRYFAPRDQSLLPAMRATRIALAPKGHDFWTATLGFHFSHSIGALLFALLVFVQHSQPLVWLGPLLIAVSAMYTLVAWRCWFHIPLIGTSTATLALAAGWLAG